MNIYRDMKPEIYTRDSDASIYIPIVDHDNLIISPLGRIFKFRVKVQRQKFEAYCNALEMKFENCRLGKMPYMYAYDDNGDKRLVEMTDKAEDIHKECIDCVIIDIPKNTFKTKGYVSISTCIVSDGPTFENYTKDTWSPYENINANYI